MSPKALADQFISDQKQTFGLRGAFARFDHSPELPRAKRVLTDGNHFRCGFNGFAPGIRRNFGDTYWVDYSVGVLKSDSIQRELVRALRLISDREGKVSLPYTGSPFSKMLPGICRMAEIPFVMTNLRIENLWEPENPRWAENAEHIDLSMTEFISIFREFADLTLCSSPMAIFLSLFGVLSSHPHIYDNHGLHLSNFNFDFISNCTVGPPNWHVTDHERFMSSRAYLLKKDRAGIPSLFHYTPELIRAFLNRAETLALFTTNVEHSYHSTVAIFANLGENSPTSGEFPAEWPGRKLQDWLDHDALEFIHPSAAHDLWATPISVMAKKFNLNVPSSEIETLKDHYGTVF